jgi:hypothetical protein
MVVLTVVIGHLFRQISNVQSWFKGKQTVGENVKVATFYQVRYR